MAIDRRAARLSTLALVGVVLMSLLGVRLWFLQTVEASELQEDVVSAQTRVISIPPERGRIFDADGRILAGNARILTLGVDSQFIRSESNRTEIFTRLSGWVDVPVATMEAQYQSKIHSPFLPFPIKRGIDEATATAILERIEDYPGVSVFEEWRRIYPYAPLASHVVGYMSAISEERVEELRDKGYSLNERVGNFGVELEFEELLHGEWGKRVVEVDAANRPIRTISETPPVKGFDIQLTIDLDIQQYIEQSLATTLEMRRGITAPNPRVRDPFTNQVARMDPTLGERVFFKAPAGAAVVLNYATGEIAALASYPTFDNRWFEAGLSDDKFGEIFPITEDPDKSILVNRAIQGRYNVGSTFKPFTAYAALSSGLLSTSSFFFDSGTYKLESIDQDICNQGVRCTYKNAICPNGKPCDYGSVNVESALAVSSDAFFYSIGEKIMMPDSPYEGLTLLQDKVRQFGFGSDTGVELPYEFDGTVPDAELKARYAEAGIIRESEGGGYFVGDNVQLAIGQGLLSATPLHLAYAYGALANNGLQFQPSVLKAVLLPGTPDSANAGFADIEAGEVYEHEAAPTAPILAGQVPIEPEHRRAIVSGLRRVIKGPGANGKTTTGEELFYNVPSDGIQIAGKTGTAQGFGNYPWNDSSAFVGFAVNPATLGPDMEDPFVVSAILDKAGYGSTAAAPLVKCTFSALSGDQALKPVELSDELDITQTVAAAPYAPADMEDCKLRNDAGKVSNAILYEQGGRDALID